MHSADDPVIVLVVDDEVRDAELCEAVLEGAGYRVVVARDVDTALRLIDTKKPELALLDVRLPGHSGYDICALLKKESERRRSFFPVVMMTAIDAPEEKVRAIEAGADDLLTKPIRTQELFARVSSLIRSKHFYDQLEEVESVLFSLAKVIEARDAYTEFHTERVADYSVWLGQQLHLSSNELREIYMGGMLHDIGKVGIPDAILLKPGPLTPEEFETMKKHVVIGEAICRPLRSVAGALAAIRHHHERLDGSGYPDGLRGDAIPLSARIVSICDAYDALTSDRPYRNGLTSEEACRILRQGAETIWERDLVEIFITGLVQTGYI